MPANETRLEETMTEPTIETLRPRAALTRWVTLHEDRCPEIGARAAHPDYGAIGRVVEHGALRTGSGYSHRYVRLEFDDERESSMLLEAEAEAEED